MVPGAVALEQLREIPSNLKCADCSAPDPDWTSINFGILVCIECSGIHRSLGVHVSKVRSLPLDEWAEETLSVIFLLWKKLYWMLMLMVLILIIKGDEIHWK